MCIWNPKAIDYRKGTDIYDIETDTYYTEEEAHATPPEIRRRLVNKGRKIGAWVLSLEELKELRRS